MQLVVLGSGSTVPHPRRTSSLYWLETSGRRILLDCSATASSRTAAEGLDWPELDAIWVSHFHMDHCGGLGPLLTGMKHASETNDRDKPLKIFGPKGVAGLVGRFSDVNNYRLLEQSFPVEIVEIDTLEPFEIVAGIEATAMKTPHTPESHAIHIRDIDGTTVVYSADSAFTQDIATLARGVDLFILECTYFKNKPVDKHLELGEAIYLIRKAKPKRAMLTHFYPEWDAVDFQKEVAKLSPMCEVIEAVDGLRIKF